MTPHCVTYSHSALMAPVEAEGVEVGHSMCQIGSCPLTNPQTRKGDIALYTGLLDGSVLLKLYIRKQTMSMWHSVLYRNLLRGSVFKFAERAATKGTRVLGCGTLIPQRSFHGVRERVVSPPRPLS